MSCQYGGCQQQAEVELFAAYETGPHDAVHPLVARYPMPIIQACRFHILATMDIDQGLPGGTAQYVIRRAR